MRTTITTPSIQRHRTLSEQKVRAEVVLGSPSANCGGVGICRVMAYGEGVGVICPDNHCLAQPHGRRQAAV